MAAAGLRIVELDMTQLARVGEIDRAERIDAIYVQHGSRLELREGDHSSPPWEEHGDGEHSVGAVRGALEQWVSEGATVLGAFEGDHLVGLAAVRPQVREGVAQLCFLYVTAGHRGRGIGTLLEAELVRVARYAGDTTMVVSATPSRNTVDFYVARGFEPMAAPLPELVALEPDDVHLSKRL